MTADPSVSFSSLKFHSVRGVVASNLDTRGLSIESIMDHMSWSSSSTFYKFYSKGFVQGNNSAILGGNAPHSQELSEAI